MIRSATSESRTLTHSITGCPPLTQSQYKREDLVGGWQWCEATHGHGRTVTVSNRKISSTKSSSRTGSLASSLSALTSMLCIRCFGARDTHTHTHTHTHTSTQTSHTKKHRLERHPSTDTVRAHTTHKEHRQHKGGVSVCVRVCVYMCGTRGHTHTRTPKQNTHTHTEGVCAVVWRQQHA